MRLRRWSWGSRRAPNAGMCRRGSPGSPTGRSCRGGPGLPPTTSARAVVATLRGVDEDVDSEDPTSSGIVEDLIGKFEQQAWFLSAEVRKPVR